MGLQAAEVERARSLMYLDRIPAAQTHRSPILALQVRKLVSPAGRAGRVTLRLLNLTNGSVPDIHGGDPARQFIRVAAQDLQRVCHLQSPNHCGDRIQNTRGFTSRLRPSRRLGVNATQAGRLPWNHRHGQPVTSDSRAVNPGDAGTHRIVVHQVPGFEIIRAIKDQIHARKQLFRI